MSRENNLIARCSPPLEASRQCRKWPHSGFTLIELLVVIVIVGIVLTMAGLSMGVLGRDNEIEDQAKRLQAVINQVREESELQGHDIGLLIEQNGYFFMRYDYATHHWQVMSNDELTAYRKLPDGLQFRLWLEGREVVVKTHEQNKELLARVSSSSSSSSSSAATDANTALKDDVVPQVAILSSGELSPFELRLARDDGEFSWRLIGAADNTLSLDSGDNLQ
ncbi:MAG: type II secretion system minor pseudopilin GspH [Steroidobacteraceae bacterium]